jgi:hypothetical protein
MRIMFFIFGLFLLSEAALADECLEGGLSCVNFKIESGLEFEARVIFQSAKSRWPELGKSYVLAPSSKIVKRLSCTPGEKICYGAGIPPTDQSFMSWGVGTEGTLQCTNCCIVCDASNSENTFSDKLADTKNQREVALLKQANADRALALLRDAVRCRAKAYHSIANAALRVVEENSAEGSTPNFLRIVQQETSYNNGAGGRAVSVSDREETTVKTSDIYVEIVADNREYVRLRCNDGAMCHYSVNQAGYRHNIDHIQIRACDLEEARNIKTAIEVLQRINNASAN